MEAKNSMPQQLGGLLPLRPIRFPFPRASRLSTKSPTGKGNVIDKEDGLEHE